MLVLVRVVLFSMTTIGVLLSGTIPTSMQHGMWASATALKGPLQKQMLSTCGQYELLVSYSFIYVVLINIPDHTFIYDTATPSASLPFSDLGAYSHLVLQRLESLASVASSLSPLQVPQSADVFLETVRSGNVFYSLVLVPCESFHKHQRSAVVA